MTAGKESSNPSMEEILSSIRQLIGNDSPSTSSSSLSFQDKEEDVLDLTNLLPNEGTSKKTKEKKSNSSEKKAMSLPAWAENIKSPFPTESRQEDRGTRKDELFISRVAAAETAQALQNLADFSQKKHQVSGSSLRGNVDAQAVENQLREILRPLLKEWLDANLPLLVRWIVNEQIEKLIQQYGLVPADPKK
jgi:cell pole-organizing protein PopZ